MSVEVGLQKDCQHADYPVQRRPHLVTHVGEELRLGAIRAFQMARQLVFTLFGRFAFGEVARHLCEAQQLVVFANTALMTTSPKTRAVLADAPPGVFDVTFGDREGQEVLGKADARSRECKSVKSAAR